MNYIKDLIRVIKQVGLVALALIIIAMLIAIVSFMA